MLPTLRLATRSLLRSPGFTILAVITLGLGIGANTAMFSILNTILLKPLPYPQTEQLERLDRATPQNPQGRVSPPTFSICAATRAPTVKSPLMSSATRACPSQASRRKSSALCASRRTSFQSCAPSRNSGAISSRTRKLRGTTASSCSVSAPGKNDSVARRT